MQTHQQYRPERVQRAQRGYSEIALAQQSFLAARELTRLCPISANSSFCMAIYYLGRAAGLLSSDLETDLWFLECAFVIRRAAAEPLMEVV